MTVFSPDELMGVVNECSRLGVQFAEVFAEHRTLLHVSYEDSHVERVWSGSEAGIGIRMMLDGSMVYTTANTLDLDELTRITRDAYSVLRASGDSRQIQLGSGRRATAACPFPLAANELLLAAVSGIDASARAYSPAVQQVKVDASATRREILLANTHGTVAGDLQHLTVVSAQVVSVGQGRREMGTLSLSRSSPVEAFLRSLPPGCIGADVAHLSVMQLDARPAPVGTLTVVVGSGRGGALVHEACVHPLEGDFICRDNSVYRDRLGCMIASPLVTVMDDAINAGDFPGAYLVDDEGTTGRTNVLVEKGRLCSYLTDSVSAARLRHPLTGNARRQSYEHMPLPRMTNTFIAPGHHHPAEIIAATRQGIYARQVGGGQVNQVTGEFVFNVTEGYLIENGRITAPIRPTILVGSGPRVLMEIDMVGNDLELAGALCGKNGQSVMVGVGQPTIRVREMVVGGTRR